MLEQPLFALVRAALLAELPEGVAVLQKNNPVTVGVASGPTIYMEVIVPGQRVGWLSRQDRLKLDTTEFDHEELQWFATTLQISALARLVTGEPSAADLAQTAADILQGDAGLAVLAAQRVRPLRIVTSRTVYFLNDSQQYEANPSFDITLMHVQIRGSLTPRVETILGGAEMVN